MILCPLRFEPPSQAPLDRLWGPGQGLQHGASFPSKVLSHTKTAVPGRCTQTWSADLNFGSQAYLKYIFHFPILDFFRIEGSVVDLVPGSTEIGQTFIAGTEIKEQLEV